MRSASWVAKEMLDADFGDQRLNHRLKILVAQLASQPMSSLPEACGSWADTKAAYRFISSAKVTAQGIRDASLYPLLERLPRGEATILAIQDTTELDFTSRPPMQGLGPRGPKDNQGLYVHSVLTCDTQGVPQGLLWQEVWARDPKPRGQGKNWRKRPLSEKESKKWLTALEKTEWLLPEQRHVVLIGDREADMFPLFATPRRAQTDLLVRAAYDRRIQEEAHTIPQALEAAPIAGEYTLCLRSREGRPEREATMSVRFTQVTLLPPPYYQDAYQPVRVQVIEAWEAHPPEGVEPLHWILLTSLPIQDFADACQYLQWYSHRWQIEQYHRTLKSGCRIEALQLQTAARLEVALALYCIVAWRLLWLTYEARQRPEDACSRILQPYEWKALYCTLHRTPTPPRIAPSLREAVRWIGRLGGFLGRKGDGEPGVQTLWRGMQRLNDIALTWKLMHPQDTYG